MLGLSQLEFDGCSDIYVRSWDDWMTFYTSPEYAKALARKSLDLVIIILLPLPLVSSSSLFRSEALPLTKGLL